MTVGLLSLCPVPSNLPLHTAVGLFEAKETDHLQKLHGARRRMVWGLSFYWRRKEMANFNLRPVSDKM